MLCLTGISDSLSQERRTGTMVYGTSDPAWCGSFHLWPW